jgi:osmoprotectant transport system permease protein
MSELVDFMLAHRAELGRLFAQHVALVATAVAAAIAAGLPLGIAATRSRRLERAILGTANVFQTIPSLALFGFLLPLPFVGGVGARPAIVALTLYAILPIARNTHAGIRAIDPAIVEAGRGMGMTERQLLLKVELPLAVGVILAGVRVATVVSVGVATIAAAIGAGGLGVFIFRGIAMVDNVVILTGAMPAALLALAADALLGFLERRLTAPGIGRAPRGGPVPA